jgi:hypothetical protein
MSKGSVGPAITGVVCSAMALSSRPAKLGTAGDAGAHNAAIAQLGVESGVDSERVCEGTVPCSGISHCAWVGCLIRPKHAAVPRIGWNWNSSRNAAKRDLILRTLPLGCIGYKNRIHGVGALPA